MTSYIMDDILKRSTFWKNLLKWPHISFLGEARMALVRLWSMTQQSHN